MAKSMKHLSSSVPNLSELLGHVKSEGELQKVIADERMRAQKHKDNYEQLKSEFERLLIVNNQLKNDIDQKNDANSPEYKFDSVVKKLENRLQKALSENENLKEQSITPNKLELIKARIMNEFEGSFREKILQLQEEIESQQTEFNKLRYDYTFLKFEYENEVQGKNKELKDSKSFYEETIANLVVEKENLLEEYSKASDIENKRMRSLQQENINKTQKIKSLEGHIEELQTRIENEKDGEALRLCELKSELSETSAKLKISESEKSSLSTQNDYVKSVLKDQLDLNKELSNNVSELKVENSKLCSNLEELSHRFKLSESNFKLEKSKFCNKNESEIEVLRNINEELHTNVEVLRSTIESNKKALINNEKEHAKAVKSLKEDFFQKSTFASNIKIEQEAVIDSLQKRIDELNGFRNDEREKFQEMISSAEKQNYEFEKQMVELKTRLEIKETIEQELEQEKKTSNKIRQELSDAQHELMSLQQNDMELTKNDERLKGIISSLTEKLHVFKSELNGIHDKNDIAHCKEKLDWEKDRHSFCQKIDKLELELHRFKRKLKKVGIVHQKKKAYYQEFVNKLKERASQLEIKEGLLRAEQQHMNSMVPKKSYSKLHRQLRDLQRKYGEFTEVIQTDPNFPLIDEKVLSPNHYNNFDSNKNDFETFNENASWLQDKLIRCKKLQTNEEKKHYDLMENEKNLSGLMDSFELNY